MSTSRRHRRMAKIYTTESTPLADKRQLSTVTYGCVCALADTGRAHLYRHRLSAYSRGDRSPLAIGQPLFLVTTVGYFQRHLEPAWLALTERRYPAIACRFQVTLEISNSRHK